MTNKVYRVIPPALLIAQLFFALNSQTQIRYEELAEGVRNPFWLEQRQIYDGVSSNVGWYGSLLLVYKLFGFSLQTAQYFKLALYFISMVCLGLLLKRWIRHAWFPLLTIGLSPTLLFYNSSQTSHGIDLLYFPIVLYLILSERRLVNIIGWALAMWAWMSYPTFIFYLPVLVVLSFVIPAKARLAKRAGMTAAFFAFLTPLGLAFLLIKNRSQLLFDPKINSGIFRGAGGFDLSLDNIANNLGGFFRDLFAGGNSYHFEVNQAEFSLIFPIITVLFIAYASFKIFSIENIMKRLILLVLVSLISVLILSSLTLDPSGSPGMRRFTPVLTAFYALFVLVWKQLVNVKSQMSNLKWVEIGILSLLLIHHLIVYPINLIHLKDPSPAAYPIWFNSTETPAKSLQNLVETAQKEDLKLACMDEKGAPFYCRLSEVYAAVAGSCKWNHLSCRQILGYDFSTGQFIPLDTSLWDSYFDH